MTDSLLVQTPSVTLIVLQSLLEFLQSDKEALRFFAIGWYHQQYPIFDYYIELLGLDLEEE